MAYTPKKIAAAKKKGGIAKKRAVFAENMKKIAKKHNIFYVMLLGSFENPLYYIYTMTQSFIRFFVWVKVCVGPQ